MLARIMLHTPADIHYMVQNAHLAKGARPHTPPHPQLLGLHHVHHGRAKGLSHAQPSARAAAPTRQGGTRLEACSCRGSWRPQDRPCPGTGRSSSMPMLCLGPAELCQRVASQSRRTWPLPWAGHWRLAAPVAAPGGAALLTAPGGCALLAAPDGAGSCQAGDCRQAACRGGGEPLPAVSHRALLLLGPSARQLCCRVVALSRPGRTSWAGRSLCIGHRLRKEWQVAGLPPRGGGVCFTKGVPAGGSSLCKGQLVTGRQRCVRVASACSLSAMGCMCGQGVCTSCPCKGHARDLGR